MPRSPGVLLAIMHDHAGTVIGGTIDVRRPVRAALHQAGQRRQLVSPAIEDERWLGAVEPDDHDSPPAHPPTYCSHRSE